MQYNLIMQIVHEMQFAGLHEDKQIDIVYTKQGVSHWFVPRFYCIVFLEIVAPRFVNLSMRSDNLFFCETLHYIYVKAPCLCLCHGTIGCSFTFFIGLSY